MKWIIASIIALVILILIATPKPDSLYSNKESEIELEDIDQWGVKQYMDLQEVSVRACPDYSDNCYNLFADIEDGCLTTMYFSNGGYVNMIDMCFYSEYSDEAIGSDHEDRGWDVVLNNADYYYRQAAEEWADRNNYILLGSLAEDKENERKLMENLLRLTKD